MFESAELGHKIKKSVYEEEVPLLREALLNTQIDLAESARFPVIILVGGLDGAGRGATVNLLNEWMDPRHIQTHGMGEPHDVAFLASPTAKGKDWGLSWFLVHLADPQPGQRRHQGC
jgi:polyphosphate kinase 2 (PPK2 family)